MRAQRIPLQRPPRVPWAKFAPLFWADFQQGQHITIIGPNGLGKTTLMLELTRVRRHKLFIATKRRDPLYDELQRRGFHSIESISEIEMVEGAPRFNDYLLHPKFPSGTSTKARKAGQRRRIEDALQYAMDAGGWCVMADELIYLIQVLGLDDEFQEYWYQARTERVTLVGNAQRPAWVPRAAYSQAKHIFLFKTSDNDDLKRLGDIAGADVDRVRYEVQHLGPFEWLYVQPHVVGRPEGVLLVSKVELGHVAATQRERDGVNQVPRA